VITLSHGQAGKLKRDDPPVGFAPCYLYGKLMGRCWWYWFPSFDSNFRDRHPDEVAEASVSWLCWWFTVTRWPGSRKERAAREAAMADQCGQVAQP